MDRERFQRVEALFEKALRLEGPDREAFLDRECGDDAGLRREIESLLTADSSAGDRFLEQPVDPADAESALRDGTVERERVERERVERERVERYRVLRKIGEGGMSEVYLAVRADDEYSKRVALKIIRHGLDREDVLRRFRTERQILAGLDHPNIAKLLDGGTTEDGLPYFVMDYIDGLPIDEYCDRNGLSVRERLELFRTVCSAVQSAHQNLVVHRDIKSGNILVTSDGAPRLLDFGIAKLLKPDQFAGNVEYTATWIRPMTPRYASPEQIEGKPVTTTTDVYSLGVLLYKLLTGHLPYDLEGRPPQELANLVLEHEPERPSTSATRDVTDPTGRSTTTADKIAHARRLQPDQLRRRLSGDLDNIVLMALRKEPQRRYPSVEQFSEDIRRHLTGLPVAARKDTVGYRTAKFLRRNGLAVAAVGAFVVVLIGFSIAMAVLATRVSDERDQARLERDRAEQVVEFMEDIFEVSDPFAEGQEKDITAREILDRGAERVSLELRDQPEVQATLIEAIGNVFGSLGYYDRAEPLLREALSIRREVLGPDHPMVAQSLTDLGTVLSTKGDFEKAEPLLTLAVSMRRSSLGDDHPDLAESLFELARFRRSTGDLVESERLCVEAIDIIKRTTGDAVEIARIMVHLGFTQGEMGNLPAAEETYRKVLSIRRRHFDEDHPAIGESLSDLGTVLGIQGNYDEAEPLLREALAVRERALEPDHPALAETLNNLGQLMKVTGNYGEAEQMFTRALEIEKRRRGPGHPMVAVLNNNLARLAQDQGEFARAEPLARQSLAIRREALGEANPETGVSFRVLGDILLDLGRIDEAEPLLRRSVEILEAALPEEHWLRAESRSILGECLAAGGRFEEGEPLLVESYEALVATRGAGHRRSRQAQERVVALYDAWSRPEEAERYRALHATGATD